MAITIQHRDERLEIGDVYNRLQEANKIIAELVCLLKDTQTTTHPIDVIHLNLEIASTIEKYGEINGD